MTTTHPSPEPDPYSWLEHPLLRRGVKLVLDTGLSGLAWATCEVAFSDAHRFSGHTLEWMALALAMNLGFQLYRQHYRLIGFKDAIQLLGAALALGVVALLLGRFFPGAHAAFESETVITAALTTGGAWAILRGSIRAWHERILQLTGIDSTRLRQRTLIVGAGRAGLMVAHELRRHPELGSKIVGYIDDAMEKQGIRIQGVPVLGPSAMMKSIIQERHISQVVLAIPSASGAVIRGFAETLRDLDVELKTVPGIFDLLGPKNWRPELRPVSIEDLLRREPVTLDQSALSLVLEDAVVLITGGGGSIGSELARQVATFRPARIVLLGRGENSLWEAERSLRALYPNQSLSLELCDIRNFTRVQQVFQRWNPHVVFHAAAHKHVPYLEAHPEEAVENNIFGTENILRSALTVGTHTFVNISTDKAVNPTNVLGATKRLAEQLVLQAAGQSNTSARYVSVRFGNVLGSRGSVIPIFKEQIRLGGPITVTHPDMTRYFMTIPEASQLVLQAGILGETGKVYVLDMGNPVRIVDLATDMARLSGFVPGQDIEIEYSGIRPGEKLFEELFTPEESARSQVHPKVFEADQELLDHTLLDDGISALRLCILGPDGVRQPEILYWLKRLVPTYSPSPTGLGRYGEEARDRRISGSHPIILPGR